MDYGHPELADRLAAAYVLGTLRGPARRRFEALLPAHPGLRAAVAGWQARLLPLSASVAPVEPPASAWPGIERRLFGAPPAPAPAPRWWRRLGLWRGLSAASTVAAVALLVVATQAPPPQAPVLVVLGASDEAARAMNARFVASVSADGRALVLRPVDAVQLDPGRALELWAVPAQGAPRSLGLVRGDGATTLLRAQLLQDTAAFAISVEPPGGSPTGAPTGPIVSVGKLGI
jgi:anti-sigma-K factor RskA